MRRSRRSGLWVILLAFTLLNSACAQNKGKEYAKEEEKVAKSIVLLNNDKYLVPLRDLETLQIASVHFSAKYAKGFDSLLNKYSKVQSFNGEEYLHRNINTLSVDLKLYNTIIMQLTDADLTNPRIIGFIIANQALKNIIVALNGKGTGLAKLNEVTAPVIWTDRTTDVAALYTAQVIFGGVAVTNKLRVSYAARFQRDMGYAAEKIRLQYTAPEAAGINSDNLKDVDKIAREAISAHATPGCVVLVVKDGKVIFNKAYGYHTYDKSMPDKLTDIFDLASMTKVSATTMEAMQLVDQSKLNIEATVSDYLPITKGTNKSDIRIRELLEHQAGLIPDIPTFELPRSPTRNTTGQIGGGPNNEGLRSPDHTTDSSATYPTKVNDGYYLRKDYFKDVMWPTILNSPLRTRGQYVYSDLSMIMMQQIVETITSTPENIYLQQKLYTPLGMQTAGFLPLYRFKPNQIIPTEDDKEYRHELLDGYVHDPTAALMGGVAGHAGLFASANDVAILFQMMLNRGTYGGVEYIKPETVDLFTAKQSDVSRRGLGFDRWDPMLSNNYPSKLASPQTYGHTGFTGTCVWVDPKVNLVYVFLSNRVNPNAGSKLSSLNIRPRIQDAIYAAIAKGM